jgi:hypothetical protein
MRRFRLLPAVVAALLSVAACSGLPGAANTNEPAGVVNSAFAAVESGGLAKAADFSCAAHKDDFAKALGGASGAGDLTALGLNPDDLFNAMTVDFQDVTATETSKSDTDATVHVKGKVAVKVDEAKMRLLVKQIMTAQGIDASDQMVDAAMQQMGGALSQTQDLDDDVHLVKEDGKWLVCE